MLSHFNHVHCGVAILSMSKFIRSEVFSCADDMGINIYHQGTGSTHFNYSGVDRIANRYGEVMDVNSWVIIMVIFMWTCRLT